MDQHACCRLAAYARQCAGEGAYDAFARSLGRRATRVGNSQRQGGRAAALCITYRASDPYNDGNRKHSLGVDAQLVTSDAAITNSICQEASTLQVRQECGSISGAASDRGE